MMTVVPSWWRGVMCQSAVRQVIVVTVLVLACVAGSAAAQNPPQKKVDVTGAWAFQVQTEAGTGTPQVTFKQDGERLTGRYSSAVLGEADLTGTVNGQAIQFSFAASVQGNSIELTFNGTVEDNDSMKGKVTFTGFGEGTFTGRRK
jgi:hypothetical protein